MAGKPAGIEVEGAAELRRALKHFDGGLDALKEINHQAAEDVAEAARTRAPVRSGSLVGTIRADRKTRSASVLAGRRKVPYAGPIHFGWPSRNITANPFLYDALDSRREAVAQAYTRGVGALVDRVERETPP